MCKNGILSVRRELFRSTLLKIHPSYPSFSLRYPTTTQVGPSLVTPTFSPKYFGFSILPSNLTLTISGVSSPIFTWKVEPPLLSVIDLPVSLIYVYRSLPSLFLLVKLSFHNLDQILNDSNSRSLFLQVITLNRLGPDLFDSIVVLFQLSLLFFVRSHSFQIVDRRFLQSIEK